MITMASTFLAAIKAAVVPLAGPILKWLAPLAIWMPGVSRISRLLRVGSYIGLLLLGGAFCSIGVFASSITPNQIVSFVVAAFLCLVFYSGFDSFSSLVAQGAWALQIKQLGILEHYGSMGRGLIDSRDVLYFLSITGLMLLLTKTILSSRQW